MKHLKIRVGRFAKGQSKKQMSIFALKYKNEIAKVYSIKIPFNRFVCVTIKKQ